MRLRTLATAVLALGLASSANATTIVIVPGTSTPWLAGMPAGTTSVGGDVAPANSPVLIAVNAGDVLTFLSSGATDHCPAFSCGAAGAEGDFVEGSFSHSGGAEHGISDIVSPIDALLGVFLGPGQPDLTAAPGFLDFSSAAARDFASLNPLLKQTFYIGNGLRNDGITVQNFIVPVGATRLFLGTMDGFEWNNNSGSLTVTVATIPEPTTLTLVGLGLAGAIRRRRVSGKN